MPKLSRVTIAVLFLAGCITGGVVRETFAVPKAFADGGGDKWDYFCFKDFDLGSFETKLKASGREGWDLVSLSGQPTVSMVACMKRRLP